MALARFNPRWALAFLTHPCMLRQHSGSYSSRGSTIPASTFCSLTSFLGLNFMLIHAGLLLSLMKHSSGWMNLRLGKSDPWKLTVLLDTSSILFHCFQGFFCQHHYAPSYQSSPQLLQLVVSHHHLTPLPLHTLFKAFLPRLASHLMKILCQLVLAPLGQVNAIFSSFLREDLAVVKPNSLLSTLAVELFFDPQDPPIFHLSLSLHWKNQENAIWAPMPLPFTKHVVMLAKLKVSPAIIIGAHLDEHHRQNNLRSR